MEFSLLLFFFAALFIFIKLLTSSNSSSTTQNQNQNLPPQPWKLPFLGHLLHLSGALPHRALGNLASKLGPIIHLQLGQVSAIVVSSPLLAKEILKTHDLSFATRPKLLTAEIIGYNYKDIAFAPYGEYWRQMRKICILELLSVKKVQSFRSIREEESLSLIESIAMHGPGAKRVNLSEKIFRMMNVIASRLIIGRIRNKDGARLLALTDEAMRLSGGFDVSDLFPSIKVLHRVLGVRSRLEKLRDKIDVILDDIISDHRQNRAGEEGNHEDLLDVLLRIEDRGGLQFPLTSDCIRAVILDMFGAGTDTSSVTIDWAMSELMKNPRVMKKAQAEIRKTLKGKKKVHESDIQELDYLKLVIRETLRLHPPFPLLLPRECREMCDIGGYHIPLDTKVLVNSWKVGRDPDYWVDPEIFIPERFSESSIKIIGTDFEYLPFGSGRRMCPGLNLGMANVELPLVMLLYHFDWKLPDGASSENLDMNEAFGVTLKRKNDLHLVPYVYDTGY